MAVKFFGLFLLEKNIISPAQLLEAIDFQESKNIKFGEYALSKGYITKKDIDRIKDEQKNLDMMFGAIAVKLNILTPKLVEEILNIQRNDHILIGEALVQKGFITRDIIQKELDLFRIDQSIYDEGEITIPEGIKNPEIVRDIVALTQKMLKRLACVNIKVGNCIISNNEPPENFLLISLNLSGTHKYEYILSSSQEIARLITSTIIGKDIKLDAKEMISDGVKEFCNIAAGNIIAKLAQKGKILDIDTPQEIAFSSNGYRLVKGRNAIYYPLNSPDGESTLILIEE